MRRPTALLRILFALVALWMLSTRAALADGPQVPEYEVKAAFLFNFAKFVEWPASTFHDPNQPIVLGILGDDPFGANLDQMLDDKTVRGRRLVVRRFRTVDSLEPCHILFVARAEQPRLDRVLAQLRGAPTLTVGDGERFAEVGGMVAFVIDHNRVRFDVDLAATRGAGLNPSSELLKVARSVRGGPAPSATEPR